VNAALSTPRPRDVDGFARAQATGRTPARPAHPPAPGPGVTAHRALRQLAVLAGGSVALALLTLLVLPTDDGTLPPGTLVALLTVVAAGVSVTWRAVVRFRTVLLTELQAGYVTTTFAQGVLWSGGGGYKHHRGVIGWDFAGVWVLGPDGQVRSTPEADVDPPGIYPSPHEPGRGELWTGYQWTRFYPDHLHAAGWGGA
jgi:hypothetical protein